MKQYKNNTTNETLGFYYDYNEKNFIYKFIKIIENENKRTTEIFYKNYLCYNSDEYENPENISIINNNALTIKNKEIYLEKINEIYLDKIYLIESQYNILTDKNKSEFFQIETLYMNKEYYPYKTYERFELKLFDKYKYKTDGSVIKDFGILTDFKETEISNGRILRNKISLIFYNKNLKKIKKYNSLRRFL